MNNKIKLAVAGAVLSAASVANAGIIIPAGDWTLDVNGNVNAYASWTSFDGANTDIEAGIFNDSLTALEDEMGEDNTQSIGTGLLPAWLGFTGTTSQNGIDVSFTISIQPGASDNGLTGDGALSLNGSNGTNSVLNRQTFVTFGTKDMGTVKIGKDLGIYASDAILNDMTLLGVGGGAANSGAAGNTTLGGIGSGYQYAAWKGQVAYTTPNMNGFQATIALTNPNQEPMFDALTAAGSNATYQDRFGYEAKASYSWTGDIAGKVWVSGASYDVTYDTALTGWTKKSNTITAADIGVAINSGNLGLVAYYYNNDGGGTTLFGLRGTDANGKKRDGDGGYLQATYVIPTGTKLGVAFGRTSLDDTSADADNLVDNTDRWTVGAYHPLTKHLNLVAEYNDINVEAHGSGIKDQESKTFSLGAILFF